MRVLIATATAGGGHLAAAAALDEAWRAARPQDSVQQVDVVQFFSPLHRKIHAEGYLKLMLIVKPIPGQEAANCDFLLERGAAAKVNRTEDLPFRIGQLLGPRGWPKWLEPQRPWAGPGRPMRSADWSSSAWKARPRGHEHRVAVPEGSRGPRSTDRMAHDRARRVATLEARIRSESAHLQASLRDASPIQCSKPWTEVHGYLHCVAPRRAGPLPARGVD